MSDGNADAAVQFEQWVVSGVERLRARGYNPTLFLGLIRQHAGAVNATKRLLVDPRHTSYGFARLWEMGELRSSVEFGVCLPWFRSLFTLDEQDTAQLRLKLHDFPLERELRAAEQSRLT